MPGYLKNRFLRQSFPKEMICDICQDVLFNPRNCLNCQ